MSAVIGCAADLDAVEPLFTSLLGAGIGGTGTNLGWKDGCRMSCPTEGTVHMGPRPVMSRSLVVTMRGAGLSLIVAKPGPISAHRLRCMT